jgi:very-short-patch-repair endonuclease
MAEYNDNLHGGSRPSAYEYARSLRKKQTAAEAKLWQVLRNKKLDGLKFRRQHAFDNYILDFYCHEIQLAVEVDGEIHNDPEVAAYDAVRTKNLNEKNIAVLRFANSEVVNDIKSVVTKIKEWSTDKKNQNK